MTLDEYLEKLHVIQNNVGGGVEVVDARDNPMPDPELNYEGDVPVVVAADRG